jgi:hypothetical protein
VWKLFLLEHNMRARQRHLNVKKANAVVALDSRFLQPQADGSNMSSWPDRIGGAATNNFSQGTAESQPIYAVNAINGNPAVRFNNDFMSTSTNFGTNNSLSGNPALTIFGVFNKTSSTFGSFVGWGNTSISLNACGILDSGTSNAVAFAGSQSAAMTTLAINTNVVLVVKKPAGAITTTSRFRNGDDVSTGTPSANTPSITGTQACVIGRWANFTGNYLVGDLAYLVIFNSELSQSMQKRVQAAAAFAFKIACS